MDYTDCVDLSPFMYRSLDGEREREFYAGAAEVLYTSDLQYCMYVQHRS